MILLRLSWSHGHTLSICNYALYLMLPGIILYGSWRLFYLYGWPWCRSKFLGLFWVQSSFNLILLLVYLGVWIGSSFLQLFGVPWWLWLSRWGVCLTIILLVLLIWKRTLLWWIWSRLLVQGYPLLRISSLWILFTPDFIYAICYGFKRCIIFCFFLHADVPHYIYFTSVSL